jgi:hypothetical protein
LESQEKTQHIIKQAKWNFRTSHKSEAEIGAFQQQDQQISLIEGQISLLIFLFDEHHHQNK